MHNIVTDAVMYHASSNVRRRVTKKVNKYMYKIVYRYSEERCKGSPDAEMYNKTFAPIFWARYTAMKQNPTNCCRKAM
jgi:hypothetical protein